jgi:hypothetical protein
MLIMWSVNLLMDSNVCHELFCLNMKVISLVWYNKTSQFYFAAIIIVLMANDSQTYTDEDKGNEQL